MYVMLGLAVLFVAMPVIHSQIMADAIVETTDGGTDPLKGALDFMLSPKQLKLNLRCDLKCRTESCYLSDPDDCRNFIQCKQLPGHIGHTKLKKYFGVTQKCAFGTFWGGFQKQKKVTCDIPENVFCNIDYCQGRTMGERYDHVDGNCKTYWECGLKGPIPKCCYDGYRYDHVLKDCVEDLERVCRDACPIKIDACLGLGQLTDFFDDGNCRTYWDCEDRRPHPVCCPVGQGYVRNVGCVDMPRCRDACPKQYEPEICLTVDRYALNDSYCRTFMKCNSIDGDERWCCPRNQYFDETTLTCVEATASMNLQCRDECPPKYNEMCHLRPASDPRSYIVDVHGIDVERPCAPGTMFDVTRCACAMKVKNAPDNSCAMELDIDFDAPNWTRLGSQSAARIESHGTILEGPKLNSRSSYRFDGDLYFRAPFFQSDYENLYINIIYQAGPSQGGKQVLLSNCMIMDLPTPSLELSLENGMIQLTVITDVIISNQTNPVVAAVQYSPNVWNKFTGIYDGQTLSVVNEGSATPNVQEKPLSGVIVVAAEGLDIGGCWINKDLGQGFMGSVSKLQFSKCLKQDWIKAYRETIEAPV